MSILRLSFSNNNEFSIIILISFPGEVSELGIYFFNTFSLSSLQIFIVVSLIFLFNFLSKYCSVKTNEELSFIIFLYISFTYVSIFISEGIILFNNDNI